MLPLPFSSLNTEKILKGEYVTPQNWGCLDATLFIFGGAPYLCFSNEWTTPITGDGDGSLFIARLSDDVFFPSSICIAAPLYLPLTIFFGLSSIRFRSSESRAINFAPMERMKILDE